ncbi:MAG TPA: sulfite exporter TauE/SafE family protein [Roseiflexaceae bacterium]|nr:sulfite exporter TauE/SafE family protein [Roseiflexaceae bacterium]
MTLVDAIVLFVAAFGGGALNSVAGGGSFLSFPALLFTGVDAKLANATSTVALWPGSAAAARAYRAELMQQRSSLIPLSLVSVVGGFLGARLLLGTSESTFRLLVPYLLLVATLLFAFGSPLTAKVRQWRGGAARPSGQGVSWVGLALQLVIATYGGYFGGGIGILMLAALAVAGMEDVHAMNGLKNWLATCINGVAVLTFILSGAVLWPQAAVMILGATIGGYGGAATARRLDPKLIRRFVIAVGCMLTVYFFIWG